jgi:hypothetical protein
MKPSLLVRTFAYASSGGGETNSGRSAMNISPKQSHHGEYLVVAVLMLLFLASLPGVIQAEHIAPSVRALKIFDIAQVTPTKALQFRHVVPGPG